MKKLLSLLAFLSITLTAICQNDVDADGSTSGNNAIVSWGQGTDRPIRRYEVERSFDGENYSTVQSSPGNLQLADDLSPRRFFIDLGILLYIQNKIWYRVKAVYNDGGSSYSNTVIINKLSLFPILLDTNKSPVANELQPAPVVVKPAK